MSPIRLAAAAVAAALVPPAQAQTSDTVVVTGSITERAQAEAPYAIGVVGRDDLRLAGPLVNLSEALVRVPGLVVANRSNFAQDLQISSRGFGARAGFGVRGLRLLADGIPASGPDGQGQVSQFDLAGAERVEVLRGPFSVLYGNSSGGVISIFTAPVRRDEAEGDLDFGSFGLRQLRGSVATKLGAGWDLRASATLMSIDGFRPHSEAQRRTANVRANWRGERDTVALSGGWFTQPADDPLGLDRTLFNADPYQTTPLATQYDTRKEQKQTQFGSTWRHRFDDGALRDLQLMGYAGQRSVVQYLAIPQGTQNNPRHGGGVVDFDRDFGGGEARLRFAWTNFELQAGAAVDVQRDARRGYENYVLVSSVPQYGTEGRLRRDETDRARTADVFVQGEWTFAPAWTASFGVRSGSVKLEADDHYLSNGDDSGQRDFHYTNPVVGLRWQLTPALQTYVSVARGFESPTLNEVAYQASGAGGLNTSLDAQTSRQGELGVKWRTAGLDLDAALFQANTSNEIGVATNAGGRSAFQNVGHTRRRGAELGAGWQVASAWRARVTASALQATYLDDFLTCNSVPCTAPNVPVPAGNQIAGTQRASGFAELAWASGRFGDFGVEWRAVTKTQVDDLNSDHAPGYALAALRWSYALPVSGPKLEVLARVDNVFDRAYAGSVIVNEANKRFFETGAPRSWLLGLKLTGGL